MDTTKQFLERVTASTGNYVLAVHRAPKTKEKADRGIFWNYGSYDNLDDFVEAAEKLDATPDITVYFAVGTHLNNIEYTTDGRQRIRRTQNTASMFKALAFDLDVGEGKPYATAKEAVVALIAACKVLKLPLPMMVRSGRGLHCYWPLTRSISAKNWTRASIALRNALAAQAIEIDWSKIHDSSMVLRPVGTHHKKDPDNWKLVRQVTDCPDYDIELLVRILLPYTTNSLPSTKPLAEKRHSPLLDAVLQQTEFSPINLDHLCEGCAQVKALVSTGGVLDAVGNDVTEPMWRASLGIAKYADNPRVAVVRIAGLHPDFDLDVNLQKMENWKGSGPTTCQKFEELCPGGCNGCPNRGTVRSPAMLTRGEPALVFENPETGEEEAINLPWPYVLKDGKIYREFMNTRKVKDNEGKSVEQEFKDVELVCPYQMVPIARYTDLDRVSSMAVINTRYPVGGWRSFELPLGTLSSGGIELSRVFGNQQIFLNNDELLRKTRIYLMTYLQEIQAAIDTSYMYSSLGWQKDGTFLCGTHIIGDESKRDFKLSGYAKELSEYITPVGSRSKWVAATNIFGYPSTRMHGFFFLAGMGGFLMEGSTINALLMNMFSPTSGAGKTTTLTAVSSCWGNPDRLMRVPIDTTNALYKAIGSMNSMTTCLDEITVMHPDRLKETLYQIPQGREKLRMGRDSELREAAVWKTLVLTTSNNNLYDMVDITAGNEAQKLRMFQAYFGENDLFATKGKELYRTFVDNYGHALPELVSETLGRGGPRAVYDDAEKAIEDKYDFHFEGQERFIKAAFVVADAAGELAKYLGLINFDYTECIKAGLAELARIRAGVIANKADAFDIVGQFLLEHHNKIIEYRENKDTPHAKGQARYPVPDEVVARMEIAFDSKVPLIAGEIHINRPLLKLWLSKNGVDYTKLVTDMRDEGAQVTDGNRVSMFRGCDKSNPGQVYCVSLDLTHPRFKAVLSSPLLPSINTTPRMAVLTGNKP